MKKLPNIIVAAALMMLPLAANAQTTTETTYVDVQYLILTDTAGVSHKFALADEPEIKFRDGNIIVTSNADTLSTALAGITNYKVESQKAPTGIKTLPSGNTESDEPAFSFANATVSGLKAGTRVSVYSINGSLVSTVTAGQDGAANLNLGSLPKGIYILRTPTKSFKIVNR